MTARCHGCGHNYYSDAPVRDGLCRWCVAEDDMPKQLLREPECGHLSITGNRDGWRCFDCGHED